MRKTYDRLDRLMHVCAIVLALVTVVQLANQEWFGALGSLWLAIVAAGAPWMFRSTYNRGFMAGHAMALHHLLTSTLDAHQLTIHDMNAWTRGERAWAQKEYEAT